MSWLRGSALGLTFVCLAAACSAERGSPPAGEEQLGSVSEAITAVCSFDTVGLPCDPDGPAGAKLECEGACTIGTAGNVSCQPVSAGTNNGVICGTTNGVGDNACKKYCSGKTCLNANAPAGAACRPTAGSNPCEGECSGAGVCQALASPCAFGRRDQLCKVDTCNFADASECEVVNLRRNTLCSDQDACSIGSCNLNGVCVAGPTVGCDDGNACTDDACDPQDGGCTGTNNDNNACSDGNACFTGEHCSAGACVPGTTPVVCNDSNACTSDSCDPNTGCAYVAKSCSDGNACTDDSCDPGDGSCSNTPKTCSDGNPCTVDSCDTGSGCVFTAVDCDDNNACTADACSAGSCTHDVIACNDNDACTNDSCDAVDGCRYTAIPGCGGGEGGAAGQGTGGTSDGGTPGTDGGTPGTDGGTPGTDGGTPGADGGTPGTDGGTPGTSGTAGNDSTSGSGGASSTSGSTSGGSVTAGTDSGNAGSGGGGGTDEGGGVRESSGCGCRTPSGSSNGSSGLMALGLMGLALLRRRRAA